MPNIKEMVNPDDPAVKAFLKDVELIKAGKLPVDNLPGALMKGMKALQGMNKP